MRLLLNTVIPAKQVLDDAREFLAECEWVLEIGEKTVSIPPETDLRVQTRAHILASAPDILLGDHFEAVVILGCEVIGENWRGKYGYLKMYYDLEGNFVTEDRYFPRNG